MAKKRKVRPWPSFAECQAATIKLLRAENNKLKTRCCDLEKDYQELQGKYDKDICNVIRPQLNTETIELLCKRICDFDLSVRITRAMEATEIIYLFQLVSWKKDELEKIRNIRKVSIKNIQHFLAEHNLELGTSFFQEEYNFFWKKVEQK